MPHDLCGDGLEVGDEIVIRATVQEIAEGNEWCNIRVATKEPMYPGEETTLIWLNAKQVTKVFTGFSYPSWEDDPDVVGY